jgi:hypothetical protein
MSNKKTRLIVGATLVAMALVAAPTLAFDPIKRGVDLFATGATGTTVVSFANDPIPQEFFCKGSPTFFGQIKLQGVPLTTSPAFIAGETDTIVERLDDVRFSSDGRGTAEIRVIAIQLEEMSPLTIRCEDRYHDFDVAVCLAAGVEQPVTKIEVFNTFGEGGFFKGELAVVVDIVFIDRLTGDVTPPIQQDIFMRVLDDNRWLYKPGPGGAEVPFWFGVDTKCDGQPDTGIPGTTNFFPGWNPAMTDCYSKTVDDEGCHENPGGDHVHCVGTPCSKG